MDNQKSIEEIWEYKKAKQKEYGKKWREKNKEKEKQRAKGYYSEKKETILNRQNIRRSELLDSEGELKAIVKWLDKINAPKESDKGVYTTIGRIQKLLEIHQNNNHHGQQ